MGTFSVATSAELPHHRQMLSARSGARLLTQLKQSGSARTNRLQRSQERTYTAGAN
jgi:hypothetical protein